MHFLFCTLGLIMPVFVAGETRISCPDVDKIENLTVNDVKPRSLTVSWNQPVLLHNCHLWGFEVSLYDDNETNLIAVEIYQKSQVRFTNLDPCTRYKIKVASITKPLLLFLPSNYHISYTHVYGHNSTGANTTIEFPLNSVTSTLINSTSVFVSWMLLLPHKPCPSLKSVIVRRVALQGHTVGANQPYQIVLPPSDHNITIPLEACSVYNISVSVEYEGSGELLEKVNLTEYTYPSSYNGTGNSLTPDKIINLCKQESQPIKPVQQGTDSKFMITIVVAVIVCGLLTAFIALLKLQGLKFGGRRWKIIGFTDEPLSLFAQQEAPIYYSEPFFGTDNSTDNL